MVAQNVKKEAPKPPNGAPAKPKGAGGRGRSPEDNQLINSSIINGYCFMAHGSRLMAHASRRVAQGSWLMAKKNLALGPGPAGIIG